MHEFIRLVKSFFRRHWAFGPYIPPRRDTEPDSLDMHATPNIERTITIEEAQEIIIKEARRMKRYEDPFAGQKIYK